MPTQLQETIQHNISVTAHSIADWHERHNESASGAILRAIADSEEEIGIEFCQRFAPVLESDHGRWLSVLSATLKGAGQREPAMSYVAFLTLLSNNLAAK